MVHRRTLATKYCVLRSKHEDLSRRWASGPANLTTELAKYKAESATMHDEATRRHQEAQQDQMMIQQDLQLAAQKSIEEEAAKLKLHYETRFQEMQAQFNLQLISAQAQANSMSSKSAVPTTSPNDSSRAD